MIASAPTSLVTYGTKRFELLKLITQLCLAFQDAKILIVGRNEDQCAEIAACLRGSGLRHRVCRPGVDGADGPDDGAAPNAITISREGECVRIRLAERLMSADIVLLADARLAFNDLGCGIFGKDADSATDRRTDGLVPHERLGGSVGLRHRRLVGFLPAVDRLTPDEQRRVFSRYGCHTVDVPVSGRQARDVQYHFVRTGREAKPWLPADRLPMAGHLASHPKRQRLAASVVRNIRAGDTDGLVHFGLSRAFAERLTASRTVLVVAPSGYTNEDLDASCHVAPCPRVRVVTPGQFGPEDLDDVDTIVRLDGLTGFGPLPRQFSTPQRRPRVLTVIDFDDAFDWRYRRRAEGRLAAYQAAGWLSSAEAAYPHLYRYVHTHPDGRWWWAQRANILSGRDTIAMRARPANRLTTPHRPTLLDFRAVEIAATAAEAATPGPARPAQAKTASLICNYINGKKRARRLALAGSPSELPPFHEAFGVDNLIANFHDLLRRGGDAFGPSRVRPSDYCLRDVAPVLAHVGHEILRGSYRLGPVRPVPIPKVLVPQGPQDYRILSVANVEDRIVSTAANAILSPFADAKFLPMNYGFRPGRSPNHVLADMARAIEGGYPIVVLDDIRRAFDYVRHDHLREDLARMVPDPRYLRHFVSLFGGVNGLTDGIPQGSAISPLLLNIILHYRYDELLYWSHKFPFLFRFADNIGGTTRTVSEAKFLYERQHDLLHAAGFELKGNAESAVIDTRDTRPPSDDPEDGRATPSTSDILGFNFHVRGGRVIYSPKKTLWTKLQAVLNGAHDHDNPTAFASSTIDGLIAALGPCLETRATEVTRKILHHLRAAELTIPDAKTFVGKRIVASRGGWIKTLAGRPDPVRPVKPVTPWDRYLAARTRKTTGAPPHWPDVSDVRRTIQSSTGLGTADLPHSASLPYRARSCSRSDWITEPWASPPHLASTEMVR
ncbi:reverse transcriptase domain-containing protein [Limnoglobus roseus]|nr:reverse transcriptase domain-containing protein [Limnoglobus roseus]